MVLIAAAVCTKSGKVIISRQFVEMTKVRIEGLLAAFPKLMTTGKQHTFVETDSVRYVYQPLEKLYMLLITTKASNILEDLETLRLFSKVVPEYCHYFDEKDILENAFNLIFAFDEIVALGYRESVNLSQIKTFVEMDSHEEKVYQAVRQTQEREAKQKMREKAKELQRQRMESAKRGSSTTRSHGDFDTDKSRYVWTFKDEEDNDQSSRQHNSGGGASSSVKQQKPSVPKNALKLGGKSKDVDSFVDQLKNEGEQITSASNASASAARAKIPTDEPTERVHLKIEDKLLVRLGRDGRLNTFELSGLLTLRISDEKFGRIKVKLENNDTRGIQLQTHPNVDKDLFRGKGLIGLKNPAKPFPLNTDVGVLKWRYQTQEERALPLMINCWPTENTEGGFDINIEYELEHLKLELEDVCIAIPLPIGITPTVGECDGTYEFDSKKRLLLWNLPIVDATNKAGSLEFSVSSAHAGDFFPIEVSFASKTSYADLKATDVVLVDDESPVKYSTKTFLLIDKYEVV